MIGPMALGRMCRVMMYRLRAAQAARGGHIIHLAQGQEGRPHQPGKGHPGEQPDHQGDEHHVILLKIGRLHFAQAGAEQDQHQQRGHAQRRIGDAHQDIIDPAAKVPASRPDRDADGQGDRYHQQAHREGDAPAVQDARQQVTAQPIRAHRMLPGGRLKAFGHGGSIWIIGRERRQQDEQHQEAQRRYMPATAPGWRRKRRWTRASMLSAAVDLVAVYW